MRVTALALAACSSAAPRPAPARPAPTLDVRIVGMPDKPVCWIQDMPDPPALIAIDTSVEDVISRVFVHVARANEIIQWQRDVMHWMGDVERCIFIITGSEP